MNRLKSAILLLSAMGLGAWGAGAQTSNNPSPALLGEGPVYSTSAYTIYPHGVVWGEYNAMVQGDSAIRSTFEGRSWHRTKRLEEYPSLQSDYPILDALYTMSVEELDNLIEKDSTWRTGKWWGGVWTRDVSYSALLAAAYMQPEVTRISLMKKVHHGRIMEDTGTGGSWPVSTDCVVWAIAAWQLYLATGDQGWLETCYPIVRNTLRQDHAAVYDPETGLYKGESSFLDWREETYPRWMEPADISQSECLGTNALYYRAFEVAGEMAQLLGDRETKRWCQQRARELHDAINKNLWLEEKGYYAQYLYGRGHKIVSPRSETLGEALCILFGIADREKGNRILSSVALSPLGTSCISPQIPNIYPYHNNAVWPFVQAYWMQASAKWGNEAALNHSIGAILRAAAMFATNQENFVASNGDYHTAMNSPNMLWSINGQLSIVHSVFAGISLQQNGIAFCPYIPEAWKGRYKISHFRVHGADLDIIVEGFGSGIRDISKNGKLVSDITLDGELCPAVISYQRLQGRHTIHITMNGKAAEEKSVNLRAVQTSPETCPEVYAESTERLAWRQVPGTHHYLILQDGKTIASQEERIINSNRLKIAVPERYTEYQVIAVDSTGCEGFASEPMPYYPQEAVTEYDMAQFAAATTFAPCWGWSGKGAVEIAKGVNERLEMEITVAQGGEYLIDFRYANGSGDLLGYNMCCNRTLEVNGSKAGVMVFPQRGERLWHLWGYSNKLRVKLKKGKNRLALTYGPENRNMNAEEVNRAMVDLVRVGR